MAGNSKQTKKARHEQRLAEKRENMEKAKRVSEYIAYGVAAVVVIGFILLVVFSYT